MNGSGRVRFKILSQHSPGGTEENHQKLQSGFSVSRSRFETGTSRIQGEMPLFESVYSMVCSLGMEVRVCGFFNHSEP
jgi:hypothetical protein